MYFKSTLDAGPDVHYELRSKDVEGLYLTIEEYVLAAPRLVNYDGLGELATDMHVMNIPVDPNLVLKQASFWKHLEPTHVRLDGTYRDIL